MQHKINLNGKTVLFVGLSKEAVDYFLTKGMYSCSLCWSKYPGNLEIDFSDEDHGQIDLPNYNWQLIGVYPELTEEMAKLFAPSIGCKGGESYFNYLLKEYGLETALESFQSLMERENLWTENPYDYKLNSTEENYLRHKCDKTELKIVEDLHNEAQQRTFDKFAVLIQR